MLISADFYLAIPAAADLDPDTPNIEIRLGVASDDGFYLRADDRTVGSKGGGGYVIQMHDFVVGTEGLYAIELFYESGPSGPSGLELWWETAAGQAIVPADSLYLGDSLGDQAVDFDDLAAETIVSDQYRDLGVTFETPNERVRITNQHTDVLTPTSGNQVLASSNPNDGDLNEIKLGFVVPGTATAGTTNFARFDVLNAAASPIVIHAFDPEGNVIFERDISTTVGSTASASIAADRISEITIRMGGAGQLSGLDSLSFNTPVRSNLRPVFDPIEDQTIQENQTLLVLATATDPDPTPTNLSYSLIDGPVGVSVHPVTGRIEWTAKESDGPATHTIVVRATDSAYPPAFADEIFRVQVNEQNVAPVIPSGQRIWVRSGQSADLSLVGSDSDLPTQTLTWSIGSSPIEGMNATVDATNGLIQLDVSDSVAEGTYLYPIQLSDDGLPALETDANLSVVVDNTQPTMLAVQSNGDPVSPITGILVSFDEPLSAAPLSERAFSVKGPSGIVAIESVSRLSSTLLRLNINATTDHGLFVVDVNQNFESNADAESYALRDLAGNRAIGTQTLTREITLDVRTTASTIDEGGGSVSLIISRSGSVASPLPVEWVVDSPFGIQLPTNIEIPAGRQSVTVPLTVAADDALAPNSHATIDVIADGYPSGQAMILVRESLRPDLSLGVPANPVDEGESFDLMVSRSHALSTPTTVQLSSNRAGQITLP
ncbi:MAG: hypothetical protein AAFP90_16115, partial [Planctomycetota bacterium]